eukprot:752639-Hanusia_phi.AAC.1
MSQVREGSESLRSLPAARQAGTASVPRVKGKGEAEGAADGLGRWGWNMMYSKLVHTNVTK